MMEPILCPTNLRNRNRPIDHPEIHKLFEDAARCVWLPWEVDLSEDRESFNNLNDNERLYFTKVLCFFAVGDSLVSNNLINCFYNAVQYHEARSFYAIQMFIEAVHAETYGKISEALLVDFDDHVVRLESDKSIQDKREWMTKWTEVETLSEAGTDVTFAAKLVAFAAAEGIFFSSSFACIFWARFNQVLPGVCMANDFIARDEGLHCNFAVHLFKHHIVNRPSEKLVHEIISSAAEAEIAFVKYCLPTKLIGMNQQLMTLYVKFCADKLATDLGFEKIYKVSNPFPFMVDVGLETKKNFFEKRPSEYQKPKSETFTM